MIELYAKGTTDFSRHGIALIAKSANVNWKNNGQYDMDMTMPYDPRITIDYGMIVRCPVPRQTVDAITLGTVSYWEVSAGQTDVPLYKTVPKTSTIGYEEWQYGKDYAQGAKVSYLKKNYQALTAITGILTTGSPNVLPMNWEEIARTKTTGGAIAATLQAGDALVKTGDYNSTYMKAADTAGHEGFIRIDKCTDLSETGTRTIDAQTIAVQSFTITEIEKSSDGKLLSIHAEHISYQLGRVMLGDCNISRANPATALLFIRGAMQEDYPGEIETNLSDDLVITGDYSWKNAQNAILDPKSGLLQATNGHLIRNDMNVYLIEDEEATPKYNITYGTNLRAVKWDGQVTGLVTRVYPLAQNADGSTLLLPEKYIDTVRTVPFIRPEVLNTGLKVGAKEKQEDGTEITLDQDTVYARMREMAQNRFTIDEVDKPSVTLDVDWLHMPDTAEYAAYAALQNAAPGEWVRVKSAPLGISVDIQLTGYAFDPILMRYTKGTFGKLTVSSGVASYDIQSGAVNSRTIATNAVGSSNIMAEAITAREIEANSITSDRIASRSIVTELLAANAITADEIAANAITAVKIAAGSVTAEKILAGAVTAAAIAAGAVMADAIASGAITTDKLAAGSVEASKIAALAITTEKLAAGAVTADKIGAGSITANAISTDDLSAIQATLQIASIASAQIASADINYAHVKDLAADTAIFDTTITEQGVADRLYINRLLITYGQMVEATIGDLVIGASDGYYYHVDVEWDENGVPTMVPTRVDTPSAAEIAAGHTTAGQTIVGGVGTFAELSSEDFYAINSIIDRITAKRIDVDYLWARQAFIDKLMVQDISSNTYIQSTIGDWQSGSTITQTIGGINSRITQLGYGTFFYSTTPPDPSGVVVGDVWVEPIEDNTWDDIAQYTWDELGGMTWEQVAGQYRMYVWTGTEWKLLFDNMIISELQTQINQNAYAITLKADMSTVETLSGEVSDFSAELEVQAQAITAAVSSVNAKTATYVRLTDPADDPDITLSAGDTWAKTAGNGTWNSVGNYTWNDLANLTWDELAGASVYTWTGTGWIQTSNYGMMIQHQTIIEQTDRQITQMAQEQVTIGDQVERNTAQITIQTDRITQEVERATNAENGKISKTTQYQTADAIVSEAVSQSASSASGLYLAKTTTYQTADAIVTEAVRQAATSAGQTYIAKTSTYQTADSIKTEAVRVSGVNAAALYLQKNSSYPDVDAIINQASALADAAADTAKDASIAKTSTYQSAQAIVNTAVAAAATAAGQTYIAKTTSYQTADAIVQTAEAYTDNNAYKLVSGITITAAGIDISGSQYVKIASGGVFQVTSGNFGVDSGSSGYVIWSGAAAAADASFRVKKNGECTVTKLMMLNENNVETEFNLRAGGLWKLNYSTIKAHTASSITLTDGTTINFTKAADLSIGTSGGGTVYIVKDGAQYGTASGSVAIAANANSYSLNATTGDLLVLADVKLNGTSVIRANDSTKVNILADLTAQYNAGWVAGYNAAASKFSVTGSSSGRIVFPIATETAGTESTSSYDITADVTNPAQNTYMGIAYINYVQRATRSRTFS